VARCPATRLLSNAACCPPTEVIGWDSDPSTYSDPLWIGAGLYALEEMVNDTFNHPSTLTYAYINEGRSDVEAVCGTWAKFNARYKGLDVQVSGGCRQSES